MEKGLLVLAGDCQHSIGAEEVPEVPGGVHALPTRLGDLRQPEWHGSPGIPSIHCSTGWMV